MQVLVGVRSEAIICAKVPGNKVALIYGHIMKCLWGRNHCYTHQTQSAEAEPYIAKLLMISRNSLKCFSSKMSDEV